MRKILTSVLSVAGLLAVVLALASSPASAAKEVITIQTADPGEAGTYTISWETQGGCDPGSGTSGATGSVSLTVTDATPNDDTANTGPQQETGVVTDDVCNYTWEATLTNAAGAECVVDSDASRATPIDPTDGTITLTAVDDGCATKGKLAVTVKAHGTNIGDCIAAPGGDGGFTDNTCATASADNTGGFKRAVAADVTDARSAGAASATTFTITATPQKASNGQVPEGCNEVSEDTEADQDDNKLQKATLEVVDQPLGGASCMYTVTAALPAGFAAGDGTARSKGNSKDDVNPDAASNGPDGTSGTVDGDTADDGTIVVPDLTVSVAKVDVVLLQRVTGDAGGASVGYDFSDDNCGAPDLPANLGQVTSGPSASSGIHSVGSSILVELRTGYFNVTAVINDSTTNFAAKQAYMLNADGKSCSASATVKGAVPAHCAVSNNSPLELAGADDPARLEVEFDCSPPPPPEPPAEEPMDDTGDMGGGDMGDTDDGGEDMGTGDMGDTDDGGDMGATDDMVPSAQDDGPPRDSITG